MIMDFGVYRGVPEENRVFRNLDFSETAWATTTGCWSHSCPILNVSNTGIGVLTSTTDGASSVNGYTPIHIALVSFLCVLWVVEGGMGVWWRAWQIKWCVCRTAPASKIYVE